MGKSQSKLTPEQLEDLQKSTRFKQDEIEASYKDFMRDYPKGRLNREEFERFHKSFFPSGDPSDFTNYIFSVLDRDDDETIDFKEFIVPLSLTSHGTVDDKLKWVFGVYDTNENGFITQDEMLKMVESVYKMASRMVELPADENTPEKRADKLFRSMDKNQDSVVIYDEFVETCKENPAIAKALSLYDGFL